MSCLSCAAGTEKRRMKVIFFFLADEKSCQRICSHALKSYACICGDDVCNDSSSISSRIIHFCDARMLLHSHGPSSRTHCIVLSRTAISAQSFILMGKFLLYSSTISIFSLHSSSSKRQFRKCSGFFGDSRAFLVGKDHRQHPTLSDPRRYKGLGRTLWRLCIAMTSSTVHRIMGLQTSTPSSLEYSHSGYLARRALSCARIPTALTTSSSRLRRYFWTGRILGSVQNRARRDGKQYCAE